LAIILLTSNNSFAQQELYTFDVPTIDKIITNAEACISTNSNLSKCEEMVKSAEEQIKILTDQVQMCETNSAKKDELYKGISNVKTEQLKLCEANSAQKDTIIKEQQKTLDNVQELLDAERKKESFLDFWRKTEWAVIGVAIGLAIGLLL
jgi:hypothetical protein